MPVTQKFYAIVQNGTVKRGPIYLPHLHTNQDGSVVTNFHMLSDAELLTYGYYPVNDLTPAYDPSFQTLGVEQWVVNATSVDMTRAIITTPPAEIASEKNNRVYEKAKELLDASAQGRSIVEIATWPLLKKDIEQYNIDNTIIGPYMQDALATSAYNAAGLSAYLTPKINYENSVLTARKNHITAIANLMNTNPTSAQVMAYDTEINWP